MRRVRVIGVGAGDPGYVTVQAIEAMRSVDVFLVLDKGPATADLTEARRRLCARFLDDGAYRIVTVADPPRDRAAADYPDAVDRWRQARAGALGAALRAELADGQVAGILVWGDPALYDPTIRIMADLAATADVEWDVLPGISAVQALAARHRVPLHAVAAPVHVTPARRLVDEGWPAGARDVVVMLDPDLSAARALRGRGLHLYWGAYLGTPDELLAAGPLDVVLDDVQATRAAARTRHGWLMDTYLLRQP
ncbi:precorrin-6A synthase (deacetylating) [Pilimelia anulata]|uniref:precorrin-6A synthase (deacetylating) n=1 Tax=Pilimelia anulata TaxID=53371 RepID=UPI001669FC35|nr:precorrin-6A synthase (deacetylating) [Pilimelia anulata]